MLLRRWFAGSLLFSLPVLHAVQLSKPPASTPVEPPHHSPIKLGDGAGADQATSVPVSPPHHAYPPATAHPSLPNPCSVLFVTATRLIHATTTEQSAAPSSEQKPGAASSTPAPPSDTPHQYANLLDDECPWCIAMRKGPCGKQFATWQRCVKDIRTEQEQRASSSLSSFSLTAAERQKRDELEYQRECMDYFRRNAQSRRYYSQLVSLRQDEEEREELGEDDDEWPDDD